MMAFPIIVYVVTIVYIYILYNTIIMYYHPNYRYYIVLFIMSLLLYYHYWDEYSIINDSTIIMIDYRTTMIEQL